MKKIITIFFVWLVIVNLFALLVLNRFNLTSDTAYFWIDQKSFQQTKNWNLVDLHARWDSYWYLDIANNGYKYEGPGQLSNIVFFPIYPLLMYLLSFCFLGNTILAGWVISSIFLFLSLFYLYKLVKEFHSEIDSELAVYFLLIFPTAFFLNSIYTESLFLFLSIATIYYARKKNFILASTFGFIAGLTRVTGILLFVPIFWEYFRDYGKKGIFKPKFLAVIFSPVSTVLVLVYHYIKFGDPLLFFKVESSWGRNFTVNSDHFILNNPTAISNFIIDLLFVILALLVTYFVIKKVRVSYGLYMLSTIFVALSTGTLMSIGRYILVLFPIYIFLASIKNVLIKQSWIFISILLLAYYIILFVNNYWAG